MRPSGGSPSISSATAAEVAAACDAAKAAGALIRDAIRGGFDVQRKGSADLVTEVDRAAEATIRGILDAACPGHGFLGEESTGDRAGVARWIVDPLDGTINFVAGYRTVAVSIALEREGTGLFGVVHDPFSGETFTAERGHGAFRDGQPIHVSSTAAVHDALVLTGLAYDVRETEDDGLTEFRAVAKVARSIRIFGSAALDLCSVAAGRADAYWERGLKPWDAAAGALILEEAGGRVSDYTGGAAHVSGGRLVASNGRLHEELRRLIGGARTTQDG
jgi:myo-inositol-1(or 4)-monophosphatase